MKQRYRLYRRRNGGRFYLHDGVTGKQESLGTAERTEARRLLHSRNEAEQQPAVNLQIARAYLAATDPQIATRTWRYVMDELVRLKRGETKRRWIFVPQSKRLTELQFQQSLGDGSHHPSKLLQPQQPTITLKSHRPPNHEPTCRQPNPIPDGTRIPESSKTSTKVSLLTFNFAS